MFHLRFVLASLVSSLRWVSALFLVLIVTNTVVQPHATQAAGSFIERSGTQFTLAGQPYRVIGTNSHYLGYASQSEVDDLLDSAESLHLNTVRSIMHSVVGSPDGTKPTVWNWQSTGDASNLGMRGVWLMRWNTTRNTYEFNDSTVDGLGRWDYVIQQAGKRGLKLNIALLDFWQWVGGVQQINAWYLPGYDRANDAQRYTFFFEDARTRALYKSWVSHVLNRTNTLTGVTYKHDPTIFGWELMNEPEVSSVSLAQRWFREMSDYIKQIDPNHLVATGSEGFYGGQGGSDPDAELALPGIDYGTWHTYPVYHGISTAEVFKRIEQHCASAAAAQKPVVLGEFGNPSDQGDQLRIYQGWIQAINANPNCAGWQFWRLEGRVAAAPTRPFPQGENDPLAGFAPDNGEKFNVAADSQVARMFATTAHDLLAVAPMATVIAPTIEPTTAPTAALTDAPTTAPTTAPTASPTAAPTASSTTAPTVAPTAAPTASPTTAPTVAPTAAPTVAPTSPPSSDVGVATNLTPLGKPFRWFSLYKPSDNYASADAPGLTDGVSIGIPLAGGSDDNNNVYEGAGLVFATPQRVTALTFVNGPCDDYKNGVFTANLRVQTTIDGTTWTDAPWKIESPYAYDSCEAAGTTTRFSGAPIEKVLGVRVIGQVHTGSKPGSWYASVAEVVVGGG